MYAICITRGLRLEASLSLFALKLHDGEAKRRRETTAIDDETHFFSSAVVCQKSTVLAEKSCTKNKRSVHVKKIVFISECTPSFMEFREVL
jgi:hypothetical protein